MYQFHFKYRKQLGYFTCSHSYDEPDDQHVPDPGVGDDPDVVRDERDVGVHQVADGEDDRANE